MRARWTVSATLLALAALVALPATAEEAVEEAVTDSADRALVHSYDPGAMQLLWATSGVDEDAEDYCNVGNGDLYTYEIVDEETGEATVDIAGKDLEACDFTATDAIGPQAQVNHGTVVSAFVHALKADGYTGIGCYVKLVAQSDYGKGDQQIRVGEGTPEATEGDTDLTFTVDTTRCGKPDHAEPPADREKPDTAKAGEGKGKPPWAGPKDKGDHPGKGKGRP